MDIDKLYYFFAAAESESFTKAADRCHIAQTTMSKYIAQLEKETSCTLFLRSRSRLSLTKEGRQFYEGMKKFMETMRPFFLLLPPQKPSAVWAWHPRNTGALISFRPCRNLFLKSDCPTIWHRCRSWKTPLMKGPWTES